MIKAEIISHEGNPGPNWLEHCRNLATPARTTALVLVVAIAIFVALIRQPDSDTIGSLPATSKTTQRQAIPTTSLAVQPLSNANSTSADSTSADVQAAAGNSAATTGSATGSPNTPLGASSTPSLNTAKTPGTASQQPNGQSQVTAQQLTNTVQTTVKSVKSILKPLGL